MNYLERISYCQNPLAKKLLQLIHDKKTNLALSADVTKSEKLLLLADQLGPEICVLKTHIDILDDFNPAVTEQLKKISQRHHFLIFEDRKFADIGNTVKQQFSGGLYHIADWADIINAHSLPGPGIVQGLAEIGLPKGCGLLLLAEMSSTGNLADAIYAEKTVEMAEQFPQFILGFISQRKLSNDPRWIYFTPGVQMAATADDLGQQYITPEQALRNGSDVIIVGRGILAADDPFTMAKKYRDACWRAF